MEQRRSLPDRIRVHIRVRPFSSEELQSSNASRSGIQTLSLSPPQIVIKKEFTSKAYLFDSILNEGASQEEVYQTAGLDLVQVRTIQTVLAGTNATLMAYGQTGTGKTYAMLGNQGDTRGIVPRALETVFETVLRDAEFSYTIHIGFVEIYKETIQDLFQTQVQSTIKIREDPTEGTYLTGLTWKSVHCMQDYMQLVEIGGRNRHSAGARGSRSSAVFMIRLEKRPVRLQETTDRALAQVITSTLHLVDLAGSERPSQIKSASSRPAEAKGMTLPLLSLGNCIKALADKKFSHVPYRDSVLTRLLSPSLDGTSKTSLLITLSPSSSQVGESVASLDFGLKAMSVELHPVLCKAVDYKQGCRRLQMDLKQWQEQYNALAIVNGKLDAQVQLLKFEVDSWNEEKQGIEDIMKVKVGKEMMEEFELRLREKDVAYTKLLVDFNQFVTAKEVELDMLKKGNADLCEAYSLLKLDKGAQEDVPDSTSAMEVNKLRTHIAELETELTDKTTLIENMKSKQNLQDERLQTVLRELESLKKTTEGSLQDSFRSEQAAFEEKEKEAEFENSTLAAKLRETELRFNEKCEETETLRAQLISTNTKRVKNELEKARKDLESEAQKRRALELQIAQLNWDISNIERADRAYLRFTKTLLAPLKDSSNASFPSLESKLNRIFKPLNEASASTRELISVFSTEFYYALHPEAKSDLVQLHSTIHALEDRLKIATQMYESQRDQSDQLVLCTQVAQLQEIRETYSKSRDTNPRSPVLEEDSSESSQSSSVDSEENLETEDLRNGLAAYALDWMVVKTEYESKIMDSKAQVCDWFQSFGNKMGLSKRTHEFLSAWWVSGKTYEDLHLSAFQSNLQLIMPAVSPIFQDILKNELLTHSNFLQICHKALKLLPIKISSEAVAELTLDISALVFQHIDASPDMQDQLVSIALEKDLSRRLQPIIDQTSIPPLDCEWITATDLLLEEQLGLVVHVLADWYLRLFQQLCYSYRLAFLTHYGTVKEYMSVLIAYLARSQRTIINLMIEGKEGPDEAASGENRGKGDHCEGKRRQRNGGTRS